MLNRDIIMPKVLKEPLKFGDPEQIASLKMIEREIIKKCIFRSIPATDYARSRPLIPLDSGYLFRSFRATLRVE